MDKLNKKLREPRAALEAAIAKGRALRCIKTEVEYAELIFMTPSTLLRRRKAPEDLTIAELKRIAKVADIPVNEFAAALART